MKLDPSQFEWVQKMIGSAKEEKQSGLSGCDHVWVTSGGPSSCAKCGAKPVKVDDILGAKAALEEKKDVLQNKKTQTVYYDKKFIDTLKAQTPIGGSSGIKMSNTPDPKEGFTSAGNAEKFVIKIAMLTNMNVNLQGKGYGFNKKYRLKCDKCGSIQEVPREIADKYDSDASVIADFCKTHKHIVEHKEIRGRKFREYN